MTCHFRQGVILEEQNVSNKITEELKNIIEKDYVNKYWTDCKCKYSYNKSRLIILSWLFIIKNKYITDTNG